MFRCNDCGGFVPHTLAVPELLKLEYDPQKFVIGVVKLKLTCNMCNRVIATYVLSIDVDVADIVTFEHKCPLEHVGVGWTTVVLSLSQYVQLNPPNRVRYVTYYGAELHYLLRCQCENPFQVEKLWKGQTKSSFMRPVSQAVHPI